MASARAWAGVFAAWTAFVWTNRLVNLAGEDDLGAGRLLWRGGIAVGFLVLAALVARAAAARPRKLAAAVGVLTAWTVVVWVIRAVGIALGGHSAAFVVVHLLLAAVSVGLGVFASGVASRAAAAWAAEPADR